MRWWCNPPELGQIKTWVLFGKTGHGKINGEVLFRLVGQGKKLFRWHLPEGNPYLREEAHSDIFDYIEMFDNSTSRHGSSDQMSPTEYENQYYQRLGSVWITRGD